MSRYFISGWLLEAKKNIITYERTHKFKAQWKKQHSPMPFNTPCQMLLLERIFTQAEAIKSKLQNRKSAENLDNLVHERTFNKFGLCCREFDFVPLLILFNTSMQKWIFEFPLFTILCNFFVILGQIWAGKILTGRKELTPLLCGSSPKKKLN